MKRRKRWSVGFLVLVVAVVGWAPGSGAAPTAPAETIECFEPPGLAEDIKDLFSSAWDFFSGSPPSDTERETAEFDPNGKPAWLLTEVRTHKECVLADRTPVGPCPNDVTNYQSRGLIPDNCWGSYPTSSYELSSDGPKDVFDFEGYGRMFSGLLTQLFFNIATAFVSAGLWFIGWAFKFDIGDISGLATQLGDRYQRRMVVPAGLEQAAWFVFIAWAGVNALRGKLTLVAGEFLISIVLASLAVVLIRDISTDGNYIRDLSLRVEEASGAVLMAATDQDPTSVTPTTVSAALRPLQREMHEVFVEQPFDYLNWGEPLTGACADARNHILSVTGGTFNTPNDDWARRHMERSGCAAQARFNANPSGARWVGALMNLLVAAILLGFLCLLALTVAIAKFSIGAMFAVAPFFAMAAILPGRGRRLAWSWLSSLAQMALAVVATSTLLSIFVVAAGGVMESTDDRSLFERWLLQLAVMGAAWVGRRRLLNSLNNFANWVQDSLGRISPSWSGQPLPPPGPTGINLARADTGAAIVGAVGAFAGRDMYNRWVERRVTRRRAESAKDLERYKEQRDRMPRRMARTWRRGSRPRVAWRPFR